MLFIIYVCKVQNKLNQLYYPIICLSKSHSYAFGKSIKIKYQKTYEYKNFTVPVMQNWIYLL